MSTDSAISAATVVRFLKLIRLLKGRPGKTLVQLGTLLECHPRHARRYLTALEQAGFSIDAESKPPRFYLFEDERREQARFTEDEAQLLQVALANVPDAHLLVGTLRQKIYAQSVLFPVAEQLTELHRGRIVAQLHEAIASRQQVRMLRYESVKSNTISDKVVEPHSLSDDFVTLTAAEDGHIKTFKTARIGAIERLDTPQQHAPAEALVDAFDWPGDPVRVVLALTPIAYRLLHEERPLSRPDLSHVPTDEAFPYRFAGYVRSWVGVRRS
jgi:proteasome accessory factor C